VDAIQLGYRNFFRHCCNCKRCCHSGRPGDVCGHVSTTATRRGGPH
jgi:hypothetical protein